MKLSKTLALSILTSLGVVQGLIIPSIGDVIDSFALDKIENSINNQLEKIESKIENSLSSLHSELSQSADKLGIELNSIPNVPIIASGRDIIPNKYIIIFKDDIDEKIINFTKEWINLIHSEQFKNCENNDSDSISDNDLIKGFELNLQSFNINGLLNGISGFFTDASIELIRRNPLIKFIEKDSMVYANEFNIEKGSPWGLARVSHRQPLSLASYEEYLYDDDGGKGVDAYIIDTGVNVKHVEFDGRAKWGKTIPTGDDDIDGNGHGTHCAGTIGSKKYGVAKNVNIYAVKVLRSNGSGSMSDVVKGVEFAAQSHQNSVRSKRKGFKGSTANMSLGGGKSPALDMAVNAAVKAGLHFAVAAGNENQDACNTSPASAENAITVGASTISDARAYFSNFGKCVDIFAPGLNILSTYIGGNNDATAYLSGTSMASPHICGLLSYYVSLQPGSDSEFFIASDGITPKQLKKNLISFGTKDVLVDISADTPNILAFNGAGHNLTEFWNNK
ncbi:unnamed protein product [Candida verbasci]|uniref:Cerevisin n=1 Tax=Candida verbasci TaxID=1227364 RepID=A0A9W4U049_9ASCO|nr:unnamed protein product [Candida verbasci]